MWGVIHGCFQTRKLTIRCSGCERSFGAVASIPSTIFQIAGFFFHTSANLQLPRKSEPPYFCSIPIICPSVSQGKMKGLLSATPYFRERWYWSPQATLGASRIQSQGHVEQRSIRQLNVSLFFEVISLIRRQGSLWDGLDFSLFGLWQF